MKHTLTKFFVVLLLVFAILSCAHIHNQYCGYDYTTKTGCMHEHGEQCYEEASSPMPRVCLGPDCPES